MQIGKLKYTIEIKEKTAAKDEYGAETIVWTTKFTLPADVRYKSGTKSTTDMEVFNTQAIEVNIRYVAGIDESHRVVFDGRTYKISFINEVAYRAVLQLNIERLLDTEK